MTTPWIEIYKDPHALYINTGKILKVSKFNSVLLLLKMSKISNILIKKSVMMALIFRPMSLKWGSYVTAKFSCFEQLWLYNLSEPFLFLLLMTQLCHSFYLCGAPFHKAKDMLAIMLTYEALLEYEQSHECLCYIFVMPFTHRYFNGVYGNRVLFYMCLSKDNICCAREWYKYPHLAWSIDDFD